MKKNKVFTLLFLSWLVVALAIFGIAAVLAPDVNSAGFWWRVMWTQVLNLVFWGGSIGWFTEDNDSTSMGVTPAVSLVSSVYVAISFLVMVLFYSSEVAGGISDAHLIIQIVAFVVAALIILRLGVAVHFTNKDLVIQKDAAISTLDLAQKIKSVEVDAAKTVAVELKRLREKVVYSLQNNNRLRSSKAYKDFVENVLDVIGAKTVVAKDVKALVRQIDLIQNEMKRK